MDLFLKISVLQAIFFSFSRKIWKKQHVLWRKVLLANSCYELFVWKLPPPSTEVLNFALWPLPTGLWCLDICLLGNFPVSQVAGCRCTLLAGNSSIRLAGSVVQITFFQQPPKMLKMASESFIHALLFFKGLFSNLLVGCPRKVISDTASVHTYIRKVI